MDSTTAGARPERRLVQHQQLRLAHQRAADREHLPLAAGHRAGALVAPLLQLRKDLVDALEQRGDRAPCRAAAWRRAGGCSRRSAARTAASLPATARAPCARSQRRLAPPMLLAAKWIEPPCTGTRPAIAFSVVVLPPPLEPSSATTAPWRHVQRHVGDADQIAVAHFQMLDAQSGSVMSPARPSVRSAYGRRPPWRRGAEIGRDHGGIVLDLARAAARDLLALDGTRSPALASDMITSMMCSTITSVMPVRWISRTSSIASCTSRGVRPAMRLVEQQQLGFGREHARDLQPLAAGRAERARRRIRQPAHADPLQHGAGLCFGLRAMRWRRNAPIMTFSSTVMSSKVCGTWKVRARPSCARSSGVSARDVVALEQHRARGRRPDRRSGN